MKYNKKVFTMVGLGSVGVMAIVCAFSFANLRPKDELIQTKADYSLTLGSSNFAGLSTEFGDGTFDSRTPSNSLVRWSYHNAKKSGDNLVLGKSRHGNVNSSDNYVGNINPITSTSNITVNFSGAKYLRVYAGLDPDQISTFYYVGLLDSSSSVFSTTHSFL